tara:strand:- start:52 stop:249 length:198 start_codon:yes stop_codon:yes gene_type:complete
MVNRSSIRQQIMKPGKKKIKKVMGEFKRGTLKIGKSKKKVKNLKQAKAIALSEARRLKKRRKRRS